MAVMQGPEHVAPPNSSGITVIIVGLGIGGLTAAIENHRKGHKVIGLERNSGIRTLGDSIALGSNATRIIRRWGNGEVLQELVSLSDRVDVMEVLDTANKLYAMDETTGYQAGGGMFIHRGSLVTTIYSHAKSLGIDLRFDHGVTDYFEDEDTAGVILTTGERLSADCVLGADGVHSKAQEAVLGRAVSKQRSGLSAYRACFSSRALEGDASAQWILEEAGIRDRMKRYLGSDGLALTLSTGKKGQNVIWQLWHEDDAHSQESWANTGATVEDALVLLKDWPIYEKLTAVLKHTPNENLANYPLVQRPPLPTWISPGGRLMLIGDAAHAMIPAIGQGGGQAIEDAATVAICLELGGKDRARDSLKVHERIRLRRTSQIQETGNAAYSGMRQPCWEEVERDSSLVKIPQPTWIFDYDAARAAYEEFSAALQAIQEGTEYVPRNLPVDTRT